MEGLKTALPQTASLAALLPRMTLIAVFPLRLNPLAPPMSWTSPTPDPKARMKLVFQYDSITPPFMVRLPEPRLLLEIMVTPALSVVVPL